MFFVCFRDIIWVCPLSDKKFRGPAFVRKHILNKHAEKVEEEKKENVRIPPIQHRTLVK